MSRPAGRKQLRLVTRWLAVSACVLCAGSAGLAQVVFTLDDFDKAMKAVGRNVALANAAIASRDFEGAKVRVARAREQLSPTMSFWTNEKKADAVTLLRAATARLDALDRVLSTNPVDASAVAIAATELDAACQACHAVYREQDAATKAFRLKRAR